MDEEVTADKNTARMMMGMMIIWFMRGTSHARMVLFSSRSSFDHSLHDYNANGDHDDDDDDYDVTWSKH